jgi:dTDP-4-dehydrorhamnose reductase
MTKVLVTGARGVLGRQLVPYLRAQGCDVLATDIYAGSEPGYRTLDVTRCEDLWNAINAYQPDLVYNLAACCGRVVAEENPQLASHVNEEGAENVASEAWNVEARLIHLSTSEVYGTAEEREDAFCKPQNVYGQTKLLGELAVIAAHGDSTVVRPFMMVTEDEPAGPHRSFLIRAAHAVKHGLPITIHEGSARSWLNMQDAVQWLWAMRDDRFKGEIINIGSTEEPVSNDHLVWLLEMAFGGKVARYAYEPMPSGIRQTKTPTLDKQRAMLVPQKVSLTQTIERIARFMETT